MRGADEPVLHRGCGLDGKLPPSTRLEPTGNWRALRQRKIVWGPSTWTSPIPQAYMTARSVRNRLQICSSQATDVSTTLTPITPGSRPGDGHAWKSGKRWATSGSRRGPGLPTETSPPIGQGCFGHKIRHLQPWSSARQPMLEIRKIGIVRSPDRGRRGYYIRRYDQQDIPHKGNKLVVTR